jgi:hypothetical protein
MKNVKWEMENGSSSPPKHEHPLATVHGLVPIVRSVKQNLALDHLFQSDPSGLMFCGIDIDAGARTALELLAALGGQNDQTVLGIDLLRLRLFCRLFNLFVYFRHDMYGASDGHVGQTQFVDFD